MDACDFVEQLERMENPQKKHKWVAQNHGQDSLAKVMTMNDVQFKSKFRMSKTTFKALVQEVTLLNSVTVH